MPELFNMFGTGLTEGSAAAQRLLPFFYQEKENDALQDKVAFDDAQYRSLTDEWLKLHTPNPAKNAYKQIVGATDEQANEDVQIENDEQAKGAAMMLEKIAKDKADSEIKVAGGALPSPQANVTEQMDIRNKWTDAIIKQESGNFGYDSPRGVKTRHGQALGKYQIMPKFWFKKIGLDPNSEADKVKFEKSPELQDKLAGIVFSDAWSRSGGDPEKASLIYYTGQPNPSHIDKVPQPGMPTPRDYATQVLDSMGMKASAETKKTQIPGMSIPEQSAGMMLKKEVLKGPPKEEEIRSQYLDKLTQIQQSPAFIKASPAVQKKFLENVVDPYLNLQKESRAVQDMGMDDFNKKMSEWSRNARAVMKAEVTSAYRKSSAAGRSKLTQLLSRTQTRIREITSWRNRFAKASSSEKKKMLEQFSEFTKTQDKEGWWGSLQRIAGFDPQEIIVDKKRMDAFVENLYTNENELMNQLKGAGGSVFMGLPDDMSIEEDRISDDDDFNQSLSD